MADLAAHQKLSAAGIGERVPEARLRIEGLPVLIENRRREVGAEGHRAGGRRQLAHEDIK